MTAETADSTPTSLHEERGEDHKRRRRDDEEDRGSGTSRASRGGSRSGSVGTADGAAAACDACVFCEDVCSNARCLPCLVKNLGGPRTAKGRQPTFTMCQVRRHNTASDCWIAAHDCVYDITRLIELGKHPGGQNSLLMRAGQNATRDYDFHAPKARPFWAIFAIGKLVPCAKEPRKSWFPFW